MDIIDGTNAIYDLINKGKSVLEKPTGSVVKYYYETQVKNIMMNELMIHNSIVENNYFTNKVEYVNFINDEYFNLLIKYIKTNNNEIINHICEEIEKYVNADKYNRNKILSNINLSVKKIKNAIENSHFNKRKKMWEFDDALWCKSIDRFLNYNGPTSFYNDSIIVNELLPDVQSNNKQIFSFKEFYKLVNNKVNENNQRGCKIEILGSTGSGKSTFLFKLWKGLLFEEKTLTLFYNGKIFRKLFNENFQTINSLSTKYNHIVVLLDGYNDLDKDGITFFKDFLVGELKNNVTFIYTSTFQNNREFKNFNICALNDNVIKSFLDKSNIKHDYITFDLLKNPLLLTIFLKIQVLKSNRFFKEINNEAKLLWDFLIANVYKNNDEEMDKIAKCIVLYIIPRIAYVLEKEEKNILGIDIIFSSITDIKNLKKINLTPVMNEAVNSINSLEEQDILNYILRTGFFKKYRESEYIFFHDQIFSFFVAVNLINDDQIYILNNKHILIDKRYLDDTLQSNKYYNLLYKENDNNKEKNIFKDELNNISVNLEHECIGNIIGDIECSDIFISDTPYNLFDTNRNHYINAVNKYENDDYGLWSKAYFYECVAKKYYTEKVITVSMDNNDFDKIIQELIQILNTSLKIIKTYFTLKKISNELSDLENCKKEEIINLIRNSRKYIEEIDEIRIFHVLGHIFDCSRYKILYDSFSNKEDYLIISNKCYQFVAEIDPQNRFADIGSIQYYEYLIQEHPVEQSKYYKKIYELYYNAYKKGNLWARRKMAEMIKDGLIEETNSKKLKKLSNDLIIYKMRCHMDNQGFSDKLNDLIEFIEKECEKYD